MRARGFVSVRMLVVAICVSCALFVFGGASASAAVPVVEGESVLSVGSSSARLSARVNPGGQTTAYQFEYSTDEASWVKTPEPAGVLEGEEAIGVVADVQGLSPGTGYHFRVSATNGGGTVAGGVVSFATYPLGVVGLPDARGYEMVSPVVNYDSSVQEPELSNPTGWNASDNFGDVTDLPFVAAVDGSAVAYAGNPTVGGNGSTGHQGGNEFLARRTGAYGWSAVDLQPPQIESADYQAFSPDLSVGILDSPKTLSPRVSGGEFDVLYSTVTSGSSYEPLFTTDPSHRSYGLRAWAVENDRVGARVAFAGASSGMGHLLFEANDAFTGEAVDGGEQVNNLYDSVGGVLHLVNILPNGTSEANASFGAHSMGETPDFSRVISTDGSRVFWTDLNTGVVYVRVNDAQPQSPLGGKDECLVPAVACTVAVSAGAARYWTASVDGRYAFYTEAGNLNRFDVNTGVRDQLTSSSTGTGDLSAASGLGDFSGGSTEVTSVVTSTGSFRVGQVIQASVLHAGTRITAVGSGTLQLSEAAAQPGTEVPLSAGSDVVTSVVTDTGSFVAGDAIKGTGISAGTKILEVNGDTLVLSSPVSVDAAGVALTSSPEVQDVVGASEDGSYVYFAAEGVLASGATPGVSNIYVLHEGEPVRFIGSGPVGSETMGRQSSARVAPDGRRVAFVSSASLTGYPNLGYDEIYVFEAGTGGLWCASCNPSGLPPISFRTARPPQSYVNTYQPRWISSDGSVFFDSKEALVPQDVNGQVDVYEWERDGSGSCELSGGCIYLLSGGASSDGSFFIDASANGDDAFIVTRAQLAAQDRNEVRDVYDARVDAPVPVTPPACTGSGCQGVPGAPPIFATPSSVTFNGVGNFEPVPKTVVKSKAKKKPKPKPKRSKRRKGKGKRSRKSNVGHRSAGSAGRVRAKGGRS